MTIRHVHSAQVGPVFGQSLSYSSPGFLTYRVTRKSTKSYKADNHVHDKHLLTVVAFAIEPLCYKCFLVDCKIFNGKIQTWNKETTKLKKEKKKEHLVSENDTHSVVWKRE